MKEHIARQLKSGEIQAIAQLTEAEDEQVRAASQALHPSSEIFQGLVQSATTRRYLESRRGRREAPARAAKAERIRTEQQASQTGEIFQGVVTTPKNG